MPSKLSLQNSAKAGIQELLARSLDGRRPAGADVTAPMGSSQCLERKEPARFRHVC